MTVLNPIDYQYTSSTGYFFNPKGGDLEHLNIEHPVDLKPYLDKLPHLHSVAFDFRKSAYKKAGVEQAVQLDDIIQNRKLSRLTLIGSKKLTTLPEALAQHPLRFLKIINCPNLKNLKTVLPTLKDLVHLELAEENLDLGDEFPELPDLKYFQFHGQSIQSLRGISKCSSLLGLNFLNFTGEAFPEEISNLPQLTSFVISRCPKLKKLPSLQHNINLNRLHLTALPELTSIDIYFENKQQLTDLRVEAIGQKDAAFIFPEGITACRQLEILTIGQCNFKNLPESFSRLINLKTLRLYSLNLEQFPDIFAGMQNLTSLHLRHCPNLKSIPKSISNLRNLERLELVYLNSVKAIDINFQKLESLHTLTLEYLQNVIQIDESITTNKKVERITLRELDLLKATPELGAQNINLKFLTFVQLPLVTQLADCFTDIPQLNYLTIQNTGVRRLPDHFERLQTLENIQLFGEAFDYFPPEIATLPNIQRIWVTRQPTNKDPEIVSIREIFPHLQKLEDEELKKAIFFWAGNAFQHLAIDKNIKIKSLEGLQQSIKNLPLLILGNIHRFNPDQKAIQHGDFQAGDQVWINGTMQGGKTGFKTKLKELGFKVANKFSGQVRLVIIGKKPSISENLFDTDALFASQLEIENISKTENPGLLQKDDVPKDFICNLQQLLWSGDPPNESVALELVKTNGLPEAVEEDFLLAAKICKDKNLRNRIRTFVRGKISEEKQKALSTGSAPFKVSKLSRVLTDKSLARMYFAHAKQTGKLEDAYFQHDPDGKHEHREEAFRMALSKFLTNPQYLNSYVPLLESEWNQVFAQPTFKGALRRIVVNFTNLNKIPEQLFEHIESLKDVQVRVSKEFALEEWYRFYKLNKLNIQATQTDKIPSGISQLKRLRYFSMYSGVMITLPQDFKKLEHIKSIGVQQWANRDDFEDFIDNMKK